MPVSRTLYFGGRRSASVGRFLFRNTDFSSRTINQNQREKKRKENGGKKIFIFRTSLNCSKLNFLFYSVQIEKKGFDLEPKKIAFFSTLSFRLVNIHKGRDIREKLLVEFQVALGGKDSGSKKNLASAWFEFPVLGVSLRIRSVSQSFRVYRPGSRDFAYCPLRAYSNSNDLRLHRYSFFPFRSLSLSLSLSLSENESTRIFTVKKCTLILGRFNR